jgi:hypothetical protein
MLISKDEILEVVLKALNDEDIDDIPPDFCIIHLENWEVERHYPKWSLYKLIKRISLPQHNQL